MLICGLCLNVLLYIFFGILVYIFLIFFGMVFLIEKYFKGMFLLILLILIIDLCEIGWIFLLGFLVVRCLVYRIECIDGCDNVYEI